MARDRHPPADRSSSLETQETRAADTSNRSIREPEAQESFNEKARTFTYTKETSGQRRAVLQAQSAAKNEDTASLEQSLIGSSHELSSFRQ